MTHKLLLLSSFSLLLLSVNTNAQDKLHKMNGETIDVKVKEITSRDITYKKADNPDGPVYSIGKREVESIEYQNGSEDVFNRPDPRRMPKEGKIDKARYGKNILAVAPLQITEGVGVGLSYERVLDRKGIISFYLPVAVGFNNNTTFSNGPFGNSYPYSNYYSSNMYDYTTFMVMPGVKIYPTGSKGKVRYSVGPSIACIFGEGLTNGVLGSDPTTGYPVYGTILGDRFALGVIINNTLNIQPTPHLYLGLELGLGMTYINTINNTSIGQTSLGQFAFKMGYRF